MNKKTAICAFLLLSQFAMLKAQPKVRFSVPAALAGPEVLKPLFVAGDFNNWNPADTAWQMKAGSSGNYDLVKALPAGSYSFKLTRGSWASVECSAAGRPIDNRTLAVMHDTVISLAPRAWQDAFAQQARQHTAGRQVSVMSEKFNMPQLNRQRRIWIYLPAGYKQTKKRYPVIYMHDGQNLFDASTSGFGEWGVDELMDSMALAKQAIVIGIEHGGEDRITEYDPYDSKYGKGRGDDYADFVAQTLKPYVDSHYRTLKDARHTAVAGSSMGGLIFLYIAVKYPCVFGNAGIFSPSFWIAPDMYAYVQQHPLSPASRFYMICGDAESDSMVNDMQKMASLLKSKLPPGTALPVTIIKGAKHNEAQWHNDFPAFYRWLLSQY